MVSHLGRSPLSPQIIWTDLVFRVRRNEELTKDQTKVMETSRPHPSREKRQLERRTRKPKPQEDTDHARSELDGLKVDTEEPPSIPGKEATEEKHMVKKILVDLRPLLENIMDSCNHGQEELGEDDTQKDGCPSSNPGELPGEKATEEGQPTRWTTLCLTDSGLQRDILPPTSEEPSMERTTLSPEKGILLPSRTEGPSMERRTLSLQKDIFLPPQTEGQPTGRTTLSDGGPHDDVVLPLKSERGEHIGRAPFLVIDGDHRQDVLVATNVEFSGASAMHLKGTISTRGVPLELGMEPRLQTEPRSPISFPKITPSEQSLPEAEGETIQPEAFSFPDIELPTQLLLRRLGETTTSQNHLLIAHVMRYLREGLLPDGSSLFEWNHLPELPNKTRKGGGRLKENSAPATTRKSGAKFVWKCNRSMKLKSTPDLRKYCQTEIKEPRRPREKAEIASFEGQPDASRKIPDRTQRVPTTSCPSSVVFWPPR